MYKVGVRYLVLHVCVSFFFLLVPLRRLVIPLRQANCNDKCRGTLQKKKKRTLRMLWTIHASFIDRTHFYQCLF